MLRNSLKWAAENDVVINFQEVDNGIVMVVRKGDICSGICLVDNTGEIAPVAFDFVQHLLHSTIDAIRLEYTRNPESGETLNHYGTVSITENRNPETKNQNQENHV